MSMSAYIKDFSEHTLVRVAHISSNLDCQLCTTSEFLNSDLKTEYTLIKKKRLR